MRKKNIVIEKKFSNSQTSFSDLNFFRSPEQFIQTVKGENNFCHRIFFLLDPIFEVQCDPTYWSIKKPIGKLGCRNLQQQLILFCMWAWIFHICFPSLSKIRLDLT